MRSIVHNPDPQSPIPRGHVRPAEGELDQPYTKRIRRGSNEPSPDRAGRLASPSSDSQGGMADSEAETKQGDENTTGPPPKKKRTRTLTTPHQAAVLHALLAQVRMTFGTVDGHTLTSDHVY
ncbi:hypothetical protein FA15DRAFT_514800 [Coprinopsis marcescibilis]|uniref:Uncharacterized protein n=1 Tax=Coprinopsis marcescibilis TaxID=230819 RepID=A0A5C3KQU5_COPMA|nr:hypothetical protein FA15DRAFT_514800 [Coprinopsis marcescibilis]